MIVEGFISILTGVVGLVFKALGTFPAPSFVAGLGAQLSTIVDWSASMGSWVPWSVLGVAMSAVFGAHLISLTVRLVRMLISLFTGGGGSAA